MKALSYINEVLKIFFLGFLIWLVLRLFMFQVLYVDSASMQNTLFEGDYIVVNKLAYGARIPITPLSLPFQQFYKLFKLDTPTLFKATGI